MKEIRVSGDEASFLEAHINPSGMRLEDIVCKYCGDSEAETGFVTDHIVARAAGGPDEKGNKQRICWRCNQAKGTLEEEELIAWIERIKKRG